MSCMMVCRCCVGGCSELLWANAGVTDWSGGTTAHKEILQHSPRQHTPHSELHTEQAKKLCWAEFEYLYSRSGAASPTWSVESLRDTFSSRWVISSYCVRTHVRVSLMFSCWIDSSSMLGLRSMISWALLLPTTKWLKYTTRSNALHTT